MRAIFAFYSTTRETNENSVKQNKIELGRQGVCIIPALHLLIGTGTGTFKMPEK